MRSLAAALPVKGSVSSWECCSVDRVFAQNTESSEFGIQHQKTTATSMAAQSCNFSIQEVEAGDSETEGHPGLDGEFEWGGDSLI